MLASVRLSVVRRETLQSFGFYQKYRTNMSTQSRLSDITVAVLFQDIEPPVISGVRKPKKRTSGVVGMLEFQVHGNM